MKTIYDYSRVAEFGRSKGSRDRKKRKGKGLNLGTKIALGAAGLAGAGVAGRYGLAAIKGAGRSGQRYGSAIGKMGLGARAGIYSQGARAGVSEALEGDASRILGRKPKGMRSATPQYRHVVQPQAVNGSGRSVNGQGRGFFAKLLGR